jgi:hypothetical protein
MQVEIYLKSDDSVLESLELQSWASLEILSDLYARVEKYGGGPPVKLHMSSEALESLTKANPQHIDMYAEIPEAAKPNYKPFIQKLWDADIVTDLEGGDLEVHSAKVELRVSTVEYD